MIRVTETAQGITFKVRAVPRASRSEIAGEFDGMVRVRLAAPPVSGAANRELVKLLAREFGLIKSDVEIVSGTTARTKTVRIRNLGVEILKRLRSLS